MAKTFDRIFHFADLHIRKGSDVQSRYDEYKAVFDRALQDVRSRAPFCTPIAVICGDVFHDKLQISPPGIRLFLEFVRALSDMMPVVIIQGNHDMLQEMDDKNNDLLEAFVHDNLLTDVHYLRDTGVYDFENLEIGVVSIRDLLKRGASAGLNDQLPPPPSPKRASSVKIMLAHCTLSSIGGGHASGVPPDYFSDWSLVLLGDVHKRQVVRTARSTMGYSGSLIQQHFGETLDNHGYLIWSTDGDVETVDVPGEVGYMQLYYGKGGEVSVNVCGDQTASVALASLRYPRLVRLRVVGSMKEDPALSDWIRRIRASCEEVNVTYSAVYDKGAYRRTAPTHELRAFDLRAMVLECVREGVREESLCPSWDRMLTQPEGFVLDPSLLPDKLSALVEAKNATIRKTATALQAHADTATTAVRRRFRLEAIRFKWLLAFGKHNSFEFQDGVLRLINAPNGFGKSAFFECILLGLFGESFPSRGGTSSLGSAGLINRRRPSADSCNVHVRFRLDQASYTISRTFSEVADATDPSSRKLRERKVELTMNDTVVHTGSMAVKRWVQRNLGGSANYMLFGMISQGMDHDLLRMKPKEQAECLDEIFGVSYLNGLYEYVRSVNRVYKDVASHVRTHMDAVEAIVSTGPRGGDLRAMEEERARVLERVRIVSRRHDAVLVDPESYPVDAADLAADSPDDAADTSEDLGSLLATERELVRELSTLPCAGARQATKPPDGFDEAEWLDHKDTNSLETEAPLRGEDCNFLYLRPHDAVARLRELELGIEARRARIRHLNENCPPHHGRALHLARAAERDVRAGLATLGIEPPDRIEPPSVSKDELDEMDGRLAPYRELRAMPDVELKVHETSARERVSELERELFDLERRASDGYRTRRSEATRRRALELRVATLRGEVGDLGAGDFDESCERCASRLARWSDSAHGLLQALADSRTDSCNASTASTDREGSDTDDVDADEAIDLRVVRVREELRIAKERVEAIGMLPHMELVHDQLRSGRRMWETWDWYESNRLVIDIYHEAINELSWWTDERLRDTEGHERNREEHLECVNELSSLRQRHEALHRDTVHTRDACRANERRADITCALKRVRASIGAHAARKLEMRTELETLRDADRRLYSDIVAMRRCETERSEMARTGESMDALLTTITRASRFIEAVEPTLKELKALVYERHILPSVVNEANWLLQRIFGDRDFELRFEFKQHIAHWYVLDEGNAIRTEKLSGAQHFAVGLCMRLALSSLGVSKIQCDQLFIDEGFCGFDTENLRRVPELLHGLKRLFSEITVVSHLEEIRECVDEVISINRSNGISTITR